MTVLIKLIDIAPQFAGLGPALLARFISYATPQVSEQEFDQDYELAVANLTAHMLTVSITNANSGDAGNATQKKEGDLMVQYQLSTDIDGTYSQSKYGVEFLRIRQMHILPALVAFTV